jgi:hydroxyacylglutathione hydrolase
VTRIVVLPLLADNYAYLLQGDDGKAVLIDAPDAQPVLQYLQQHSLTLATILITHGHYDHIAGLDEIVAATGAQIFDPRRHTGAGDRIPFGSGHFTVLSTPGHGDHDCSFLWQEPDQPLALFSGDTLFVSGCGRLLQGQPDQLWQSLQALKKLPGDTAVYCGHEYTLDNLDFACAEFPDDANYRARRNEVRELRRQGLPTVPSTMAVEKEANPFLRCEALAAFIELRKRKDQF